jgi:tRNA nucleotidyltransferase (CCA-adding enzyme)
LTIRDEGAAREIATLAQVELAIERVQRAGELALHRFDLAVDGADVMEAIGTGPGRHVGQALRYLTERVIEDPSANTTETLRRLLADWQANNLDH